MKHVLRSAVTIIASLSLAACQGSLISRFAEEAFGFLIGDYERKNLVVQLGI